MRIPSLSSHFIRDSLFFRFANSSLQEKTLTEFQLQHLWFEHLLPQQLVASDGHTYQIIHTGWWNHESGPDFRDAVIRDENENIFQGDIEIHLNSSDWKAHRHESDPNYQQLALHVALEGSESSIVCCGRQIPTVILQTQLPESLPQFLCQLPEIHTQPLPLVKQGSCSTQLLQVDDRTARHFLQEAGWHRLYLKAEKLRQQIQRDGAAQTLWESLAEALGYKENKIPFRYLARLYPIAKMRKTSLEERDALLIGAAGFLPKIETASWGKENRHYASKLWHHWWKNQSRPKVPKQMWKLSHTRPANHPQRRLAALSLIAEKFSDITALFHKQDAKKIIQIFLALKHPFFSSHYTLKSKPTTQSLALLGKARINDVLINLVFPWFLAHKFKEEKIILELAPSQKNLITDLMLQRLFNSPFKLKTALEQQGLLQLFYTFCSGNHCQTCRLPQFLKTWLNHKSYD